MGNKDIATKNFIEKNSIFADVFNFFIYDGEQVIKPDTLQPLDTTEIILNTKLPINKNSLKKYRDVIKQWAIKQDDKATYVLLAVENQSDIHYAMPVRAMLYDALRYSNQIENIANENIKNKKLNSSNEFLSGLSITDKIMPVMTIIINFSGKLWNAPKTLKQMFHNFDQRFLRYIKDYKINLIDPVAIGKDKFDKFMTELREVLLYIKYSKDKVNLYNVVKNDKGFESVPNEAVSLINTLTGSNLKINEMKEESNMCEAIEGIKEDGKKEGKMETLISLVKKGFLTIQQAAEEMGLSVDKFEKEAKIIVSN